MLKRKFVKAGFLGHGALFLFLAPHGINVKEAPAQKRGKQPTALFKKEKAKSFFNDTDLKKAPDTSGALMEEPKVILNATAFRYVKQFLKKNREDLVAIEKRSEPYFAVMEPILRREGLPVELKYLAVVESQLKKSALSHAGARGPWQLMTTTARELGLKVKGRTDERTHLYKSTAAAARHLKSLYGEFGDWLLVIAAYNSGSGTVMQAIKKSGTRNFWRLQHHLPAETRGHVKRFIATHYYFQQDGSITMLTKAETAAYQKTVLTFRERRAAVIPSPDSTLAAR